MALVPTKNKAALFSYYCGVGCIIPFIGFLFFLPALICGILGVVKANSDKEAGGMGHAITGIVLSLIGPFIGLAIFAVLTILGGIIMQAMQP